MRIHQSDNSIRKHYLTLKKDAPSLNLKLLYTGKINSSSTISVENHSHAFYEFLFINKGIGSVVIDDKVYSVKKGSVVVYKKHSNHREVGFNLGIDGAFFAVKGSKELDAFCSTLTSPVASVEDKKIAPLLSSLLALSKESSAFSTRACEKIAESIVFIVMDAFSYSPQKRKDDAFYSVLKYFDENFTAKQDYSAVCHHFGIDRYYLCVLFKERLGVSPVEYVTQRRIELAKKLLPTFSVSEVSTKCGFENAYYFSKVFKKVTGAPPSAYKKTELK